MPETWPNLRTSTLTDQVYEILRDRIVAGKMEPGEFIREQEVSAKLNVSRTPVREALGRLASEGFMERIPHRGFRVPEDSIPDMIEFYPIIASLEVLAGRESIPKLDVEDLDQLRAVNRDYEAAYERQDTEAGIALNDQFHRLLSAKSENRRLQKMLDELRSKVKSLEIWAFAHVKEWLDSIREHDSILDAIDGGDLEMALATLESNRLMTYRDYIENKWVAGTKMVPPAQQFPQESPDTTPSQHEEGTDA